MKFGSGSRTLFYHPPAANWEGWYANPCTWYQRPRYFGGAFRKAAVPAQTPLKYSKFGSACGVVVIWTRRSPN
ncbi:MAG: hypothetical protein ABJF01_17110 [bacterium]